MKLTKLTLQGFKSFADKTEVRFDQGVTMIVGPNGCGKSNVVDAFKWVLGSQSAKSLRGDDMSDVIFNGTTSRKPGGMAEVVLTFDNADGKLPVEQREVQVGRRLYRDGTSEYILNKQVVRLRDIKELFMDTGVGVDAYSLVEQGKVDLVLAHNPVERRQIFEEAAGISKYRSRKKEAQRKLERVEQNLLRLTDIITEVDRRLRAIKVAATKARNYQEYSQRLRELRVQHFLWEYRRLAEQLSAARGKVAEAQDQVAQLSARQSDAEARSQQLDDQQLRLAGELSEVENRLVQIASQVANHQDRMAFAAEREKELNGELGERRKSLVGLHHKLAELEGQDRELSDSADDLDAAAERARSQIDAISQDQHSLEVQMHELSDRAARANDTLFEMMRQISGLNNQLQEQRTTQQNLSAQRERLERRQTEIAERLTRLADQRDETAGELESIDAEVKAINRRLDETRAASGEKDADVRELADTLSELKEQRSGLVARRDMLVSLERKFEGVADGVAELLRRHAEAESADAPALPDPADCRFRFINVWQEPAAPFAPARYAAPQPTGIDGLAGLVADLLTVEPEDAPLVQAALGDRDQWLVLRDSGQLTAESTRGLLAELPGQVTFVCMDRLSPAKPDMGPWLARPGVIGPLSDRVVCEPVYFGVRDHLLGRTLLVESLDVALGIAGEAFNSSGLQLLTRDGQLVTADGRVTLPASPNAESAGDSLGLIGRRAELREVNEQLEDLSARIAQHESDLSAASAEAARRAHQLSELRAESYQRSTDRVECVARLRQIDQSAESLSSEQKLLDSELSELSSRLRTARGAEQHAAERLADLERKRDEVQAEADDHAARLADHRKQSEQMSQRMTEAKVALGQIEERRMSARQQLTVLRRSIEEARADQATAHSDCRSLKQRIGQSQQTQLTGEAAIAELYLSKQTLTDDRQRLARQLDDVREQLASLEAAVKEATFQLHAAEEQLHEAQVAANEVRVRQEDLVQRVAEEHSIDLPQLDARTEADTTEGDVDWAAVEAEIKDLRGRIERLGNVNLDAIDEQEQLETRSVFLHQQLDDVAGAKVQLEGLIERINVESRRRFVETFDEVRTQFRELFRKLFGGGKADLILDNPDDVLECGIDIIARPPGKELRSITLLSGGEKTMTALALLLAIFRSRPSPFCILDEVDAALDEANNERFNTLVKEFLSFSQFIIITHSKRTMTIADVLYGITMQERGVSRQVAVRFDGRKVESADGESLEDDSAAVA